jgi:hypothetical protein
MQTPGLRLDLDLASPEDPQHVSAVISEIRLSVFEHGLVFLHEKLKNDVELIMWMLISKRNSGLDRCGNGGSNE